MKTRNLLLLAVACGLLILVAGGVKLLQVSNDTPRVDVLQVGESGRVGDMTVTVTGTQLTDGQLLVDVQLVGADDPDGATSFWLAVAGAQLEPDRAAPDACAATSATEPVSCVLRFDVSDVGGAGRLLVYQRAGERLRWQIDLLGYQVGA